MVFLCYLHKKYNVNDNASISQKKKVKVMKNHFQIFLLNCFLRCLKTPSFSEYWKFPGDIGDESMEVSTPKLNHVLSGHFTRDFRWMIKAMKSYKVNSWLSEHIINTTLRANATQWVFLGLLKKNSRELYNVFSSAASNLIRKSWRGEKNRPWHLLSPGNKTARLSLTQLEIHLLFKTF